MKRPWMFLVFAGFFSGACSGSLDVGSNPPSTTPPGGDSKGADQTAKAPQETPPGCWQLPHEGIHIGSSLGEGAQILRPIPDGRRVWYVDAAGPSQSRPNLFVTDISDTNRPTVGMPLDGFTGDLYTRFDNSLAFVRTTSKTASSLVIHDLASGAESVLPNPPGTTMVSGLRSHPSGLYLSSRSEAGDGPISISRYSVGETRNNLATIRNPSAIVTDGSRVFYTRYAEGASSEVAIATVPIDGSAEPTTFLGGFDATKELVQVVAADARELFYTVSRLENGSTVREGEIRGTSLDGKTTRKIVRNQTFGGSSDGNVAFDSQHFVWIDGNAPTDVLRASKDGLNPVERIFVSTESLGSSHVNAVTADTCNLFFAITSPQLQMASLYGRSRFP